MGAHSLEESEKIVAGRHIAAREKREGNGLFLVNGRLYVALIFLRCSDDKERKEVSLLVVDAPEKKCSPQWVIR